MCGGGEQWRHRVCIEPLHGGAPCQGDQSEMQQCNTHHCPSKLQNSYLLISQFIYIHLLSIFHYKFYYQTFNQKQILGVDHVGCPILCHS